MSLAKEISLVIGKILKDLVCFYSCLFYFIRGKPFKSCPYFTEESSLLSQQAKIHIYSIAISFYLYDKKHYRKDSYKEDIVDNFRNVAIPGTGIPLSIFVKTKITSYVLVLIIYPIVSLIASIQYYLSEKKKDEAISLECINTEFTIRLLSPNDWFSYWRLNSRLAGYHAYLHDVPEGYNMENKWTFLQEGAKRSVPISPFLSHPEALVVKHKNEEGGMGIFFYKNAVHGGDWIIQERISNADWVASLLPKSAPLSTFRVMTFSRLSIDLEKLATLDQCPDNGIGALSCVFRAGREGASTDHDSILFDVNVETGKIQYGTTSAHWYQLGPQALLNCPWRSNSQEYTTHPDVDNLPVTGFQIPDFQDMLKLVQDCHFKMCPDVPFVGWDVVFSQSQSVPICLLEVNLSCNFFRGSFDKKIYFDFCQELCTSLDSIRTQQQLDHKKDK